MSDARLEALGEMSARADAVLARTDISEAAKAHIMKRELATLTAARDALNRRADLRQGVLDAFQGAKEWFSAGLRLERAEGSKLHLMLADAAVGKVIFLATSNLASRRFLEKFDGATHAFVIQHDWASAFAGAEDIEGREFMLPYPRCSFEFQVSGRRVIVVCAQQNSENPTALSIIGGHDYWLGWDAARELFRGEEVPQNSITSFIAPQIKAIAIALEAKVATTDVIRAPFRLNRARERRRKLPIFDYHVLRLNRDPRPEPLNEEKHRGPRLHFRRGHWRHYESHKTWIRWTLVGRPDLGFIDKEYRL